MIESFKHCCILVNERVESAIASEMTSIDQLLAFTELYCNLDFPGGCPITNAAVEADAVSAPLYHHAQEAMKGLLIRLEEIIVTGITKSEIRPDVNPQDTALVILSAIEGGLLMKKLFPSSTSMTAVKNQLVRYISCDLK
ncbi:TetR family transcriptional regulator C-terminal domain-containing protein [Paenibacillus sepulcri]